MPSTTIATPAVIPPLAADDRPLRVSDPSVASGSGPAGLGVDVAAGSSVLVVATPWNVKTL